jgi:serine/threonine protein kinase
VSNLPHPVGVLPLPELRAPWRLVRSLGRGGIGEVFEATHPSRGRAAVKVLLAAHQGRSDLVDRMRLKGEILGALCHPNIVELYEVGATTDGRPFVAMEYLTGSSLLAELDRRPRLRPGVRQPVRGGEDRRPLALLLAP